MRVTVAVDVERAPSPQHPLADGEALMYALHDAVERALQERGWQVAGKLGPDGQLVPGHVGVKLEVGR